MPVMLSKIVATLLFALSSTGAATIVQSSSAATARTQDRTITEVVKLLQGLLDQSKADGDRDRDLYAKYKCYCDTTKKEKEAEIVSTDKLVSEIEGLKAENGKLSKDVAKLDADMKENKAAREEAQKIRDKENAAYVILKEDLESSLSTMKDAIKVLSDVGADQTLGAAADHKQYMADFEGGGSFLKLKTTVRQALLAATAFVSKAQLKKVESFLQAPFTGTYTAQSGQVVGILKDMRDTFEANLKEAIATEERQAAAHEKLKKEMEEAYETMDSQYKEKQGMLGENDSVLGQKELQLETLIAQIEAAREFLEKLEDMCTEKKKEYEHRVELRTDEETALAEAIAILNSDEAFDTFGTVTATKSGGTGASFFQRASVRRHHAPRGATQATSAASEQRAQQFLQKVDGAKGSPIFGRIVAMLQANNPFATVLAEIDKMIDLLADEGKADLEQKEWCVEERKVTNDGITEKKGDITRLKGAIGELKTAIEDPVTGLKAMIKNDEETLQTNYESQVEETKTRKEENQKYQKDIENIVNAKSLLQRAIEVLTKYYEKKIHEMREADLVQVRRREDPAPPSTWEDKKYKGQSEGGNGAIDMLEFILKNTETEEKQAHTDEMSAQHSYEDSMQDLKDEEEQLQDNLAKNRKELAEKEEELLSKQKELKKTEEEKAALEAYLEKIKPGCDYIMENIEKRDAHRKTEKEALETAVEKIKGTPAYQTAMAEAHNATLGECADICAVDEEHVKCKACVAKVTVPGYCAGHPGTAGC